MAKNTRLQFGILLAGLFVSRLIYGLVSEFWFAAGSLFILLL